MNHLKELEKLKAEFEEFYGSYNENNRAEELTEFQKEAFRAHPSFTPQQLKLQAMHILSEKSVKKVFRFYPFYHEFIAGRLRYNWGGLNSCNQAVLEYLGKTLLDGFTAEFQADRDEGYIHNWNNPVGLDHHNLNYDDLLSYGLSGLREKAEKYASETSDEKKRAFLSGAAEALDILRKLSDEFSSEASRLLRTEEDPEARENLEFVRDTACRVPLNPAETFKEALASIVFARECVGTLEGIGVSTYGQLDRMLQPYYEKDLAAGRITEEEAVLLFEKLFLYTAVRFNEENEYHETSTTVILGGCDAAGNIVCNDVTRIILRAVSTLRPCSVKFDCRISERHPKWYLETLCKIVISGLPVLVFMNDDVHIPARVKYGQREEDARLYVAGGCHEYVLGGTEVCTRADTWINITRILMDTLKKQEYADFDALLQEAVEDVRCYHEKVVQAKNAVEEHWSEFDPMPLYSTMMSDCLEKGLDVTAGGARYNSTALSMVGPANFIDVLFTVKKLCYDEKKYTVPALLEALSGKDREVLRQYIVNRIPKFGTGDPEVDALSARVMPLLSTVSGQKNGRGGFYYPAFYPHELYLSLGNRTMATPDGRRTGWDLSRGCSPNEFVKGVTPLHMLHSVDRIDFTDFTDSFALEVTLPRMTEEKGLPVFMEIVEGFLRAKGSTLQINSYDVSLLKEADRNPEAHRDLIVRVCGYSAAFVTLNEEQRKGIIQREMRL